MPNSKCFTIRAIGGTLSVLKTNCGIAPAFDPAVTPHPAFHEFQAIWDTGATNSLITQRVVDECTLLPTGMRMVHGVGTQGLAETYLVNFLLPNTVGVKHVSVSKGTLGGGGFDVLIGMDIITIGDFAITNLNKVTVFSFRFPSEKCIDFVEGHQAQARNEARMRGRLTPGTGAKPRKTYGKPSRHK